MALATVCPHCNTTFRVASDQLKLRGGIVRCGACHEVFDGNAALIDLDAASAPAPSEPARSPPPSEQPEAPPATPPAPQDATLAAPSASDAFDAEMADLDAKQVEAEEEPVYVLDFDTTFDPFGILPKPEPVAEAEPAPQPLPFVHAEPEPESEPESPADEEIVALPPAAALEGHEAEGQPGATPDLDEPPIQPAEGADFVSSLLMRESAVAEAAPEPAQDAGPEGDAEAEAPAPVRLSAAQRKKEARLKAARALPPAPAADAEDETETAPQDQTEEHDEPEFVRRGRMKERTGRTRRLVMGAGSVLLALALLAQGVTNFRNVLAARYPELKPALSAACELLGCRVELPAQIEALSVETGELQSLSATTFSYSTLLRNQGTLVQAWPHLELTLTDADDKALVRRVFAPGDYLPKGVAAAKGIAPRSEQPVKLYFELNQVTASGYHIAIFYP
jgi:predicted Zn finger-like uncharacterized protein